MGDKSSNRPTELGPGGETPGRTPRHEEGSSGSDPHQANLNEFEIDPITGNPVTRPAAANAERQSALLESVAREREKAESAARFTGRAAGNAEKARNEAIAISKKAIATRNRINRETNELLQQLVAIRKDIETRMQHAGRNAELARTGAETAERQAETAKRQTETARNEAKKSADASAESAAEAIKTVKELNTVVANYKESLKTYTENKDAELQKKVNEQLSKITKEMDEIKSQMTKLAEEKKVTPALLASIQQSNKGIQGNLSGAPRGDSDYTRSKMGICFIKFEGKTNILNPYANSPETRNIINPILPVNFNVNLEGIGDFADVEAGNYLFVDNFKLKLSDFKNMNRSDFIELILNPRKYIEFLQKLENSSVERQFVDFRKKGQLNKEDRKINKENAKIYAAKLFASEEDFNIVYPRNPDGSGGYYFDYIIMSHEIEKKGIEGPDAFRFDIEKEQLQNNNTNTGYTFFTFKIKLILDSRERYEIAPEDVKAVGCQQRKAKIYKIMGSLKGTKTLITAILGPEGAKKYLVDDTKMEELHGRAKPLPSKLKGYQRDKSMLNKLSFVSQVNPRNIPVARSNQEDALRKQRTGQYSLIRSNPTIGGKKTKRIIHHKKDKYNKKTKKRFYKKNYHKRENTKKLIKKKIFKKTRKV